MVLNNIEKLLEKYENGETSLKEEQQLKHYFTQGTVAPHLEMYKPMFAYFLVNKQERFTKDVPLTSIIKRGKRNFNYKWISVAAVAVLMLGFYFGKSLIIDDLGTYDDPQLAFNDFSKSMEMISVKFNKGASTVSYLNEVNKGASTLGYLNEIENATSIIFKN
ncbi:hypothetical protein [uncultured Algibacter sp.]|uniref:hypothetical protein n=1 Tax=uncultured Algibacter sp. TaxID=298659 RepID=UPI0030EBDCB9|tara:strand:- start:1379 stop:1867 length:489 start_codon:yes stop_codon:yes gene_type:complete